MWTAWSWNYFLSNLWVPWAGESYPSSFIMMIDIIKCIYTTLCTFAFFFFFSHPLCHLWNWFLCSYSFLDSIHPFGPFPKHVVLLGMSGKLSIFICLKINLFCSHFLKIFFHYCCYFKCCSFAGNLTFWSGCLWNFSVILEFLSFTPVVLKCVFNRWFSWQCEDCVSLCLLSSLENLQSFLNSFWNS